jgi:hypothetical protein
MIVLGGRSDVVAQWFTRDYILKHSGWFKQMVIGPSEFAIVIRDGKIESFVTQEHLRGLSGGVFDRVKNWLGAGEDLQILVIDVRGKRMDIPFTGFTKDHVRVKGTVSLTFRISPENATKVLNLISGPTIMDWSLRNTEEVQNGPRDPSDQRYEGAGLKELTVEDLALRFTKDVESLVYVDFLSARLAEELHTDAAQVSRGLLKSLSKIEPYWMENGIEVVFGTVQISENAYVEVLRGQNAAELEQRQKDVEFFTQVGDARRASELQVQLYQHEHNIELGKTLHDLDIQKAIKGKEGELEELIRRNGWTLKKLDAAEAAEVGAIEARGATDIKWIYHKGELGLKREVALNQAEIDRIATDAAVYARSAEANQKHTEELLKLERDKKRYDNEMEVMDRLMEVRNKRTEQRIREYQATELETRRLEAALDEVRAGAVVQVQRAEGDAAAKVCPACHRGFTLNEATCPYCGKT